VEIDWGSGQKKSLHSTCPDGELCDHNAAAAALVNSLYNNYPGSDFESYK
jgi:hypothetical protein